MPVVSKRSILSGMLVKEAMRRQLVKLPANAPLGRCINHLIKFKINGLLVIDDLRRPVGVVSRSDLITAFYGGLPVDSPLKDIMNGPLTTCFPDEKLETALERMRTSGIHQLYVQGAETASMEGVLSYEDVVALLYRYCRVCPKSTTRNEGSHDSADTNQQVTVQDAMTPKVIAYGEEHSLARVMEGLISHRFGAVLIQDDQGLARGVISKIDLVIAYHHGTNLEAEAKSIMNAPVVMWDQKSDLAGAIREMFLKNVQRLFIHGDDPSRVVGVLSLSDAARVRSGTCRACLASRIMSID
jgi:predicted transcriptional regulator